MARQEPSLGSVDAVESNVATNEPQVTLIKDALVNAAQSPKDQSQTSPQLNAVFRKMLLAKKWLAYRQQSYNDAMRALHDGKKVPSAEQIEALAKSHFEFERQQLAHIAKSLQPEPGVDEAAAMTEDVVHSKLPPESVVALSYFSDEFENYVQRNNQALWAEFERSIDSTSNSMFEPGSTVAAPVQRAAAVEALFKQEFPGLSDELAEKAAIEGPSSHYAKAFSLLKWTSVAANPSGALLSYAVGAIMKTEAMSPLRKLIGDAVHHSQKVWLKPAARKLMGFLPEKHAGKIITGMAMAGVAALYVTGVIDEDDARQIASNVTDFVTNSAEKLGDGLSNAMSGASELAGNFKNAHLGTLSLTDAISLDGVQTDAVGLDEVAPDAQQPGFIDKMKDLFTEGPSVAEQNVALDALFPLSEQAPAVSADTQHVLGQGPASQGTLNVQETAHFETMKDMLTGESPAASDAQQTLAAAPIAEPPVSQVGVSVDAVTPLSAATVDDILLALEPSVAHPDPATVDVSSSYTIQQGDCLSRIAEAQLKEAGIPYNYNVISAYVDQIAAHNDIGNIHKINAGAVLELPPLDGLSPQSSPDLVTKPDLSTISPGETVVSRADQMPVPGVPLNSWGELVPPLVDIPVNEELLAPVAAQLQEIAATPSPAPKMRL